MLLINQVWVFNLPIKVNSFISLLDKRLGLPNFVSSNRHIDSGTRENESSFSYSMNSKIFITDNTYLNGIFGIHQNHLSIDDPLLSINLRTRFFDLRDKSFHSKLFLNLLSDKLFFSIGLAGIIENFDKTEIKENQNQLTENLTRNSFNSNLKLSFENYLTENYLINSSILISYNLISNNYQSSSNSYNFLNFRVGLSLKSKKFDFTTFANVGNGTRIPNFYEYSFSKLTSLSNRELKPEKILNYEFGVRLEKKNYLLEVTYFAFDVQDKIIWQPQRVAFFSPLNAGRIKSSGFEFNLENLKLSNCFLVSANYTLTNALKKTRLSPEDNSYNKQLPYIPKHKASISLNYISRIVEFDFTSNYYSRRFITEDNDELFSLEPVIISNILSTIHFSIRQFKFHFQISIQNLFNSSYQLIQSFPMPGREYRLTIQMEV